MIPNRLLGLGSALYIGCYRMCAADDPAKPLGEAAEAETRKLEGIFNTDLPKTERKGSVRLSLHPHFGDFTNRSYVRLPLGARWGVTANTELTTTVEPYFAHGLKSGSPGNGIGNVEFGAKHRSRNLLGPNYDTSVGLNASFPLGRPPLDLTNGYNRYSPYLVASRKIAGRPGLSVFCNAGVNLLQKSSVPGTFERNEARSSSLAITPGFVYDRFPFHYTCEFAFETTSFVGRGNQSYFTIRPAVAWDLPSKWKFDARGRWVVGVGFHATLGPEGVTTGGGGKLRGEFGLKRLLGR